ncbi:MAG: type II secretory pathway, component PulD [Opitutus sp.]|nr:type II secretory pathway, component PulD [Opitutus sp.]
MLRRPFLLAAFTLLLAIASPFADARSGAEEPAEAKIRLLSAALTARDQGNLDEARARLEELLRLAPGDATVTRLIAGLDQSAQKKMTVSGGVVAASKPPSPEVDDLARAEEVRLTALREAAREAVREARRLAGKREFSAALDRLARMGGQLPENALTQDAVAELNVAIAEVSTARDEHFARVAEAQRIAATAPQGVTAESRAVETPTWAPEVAGPARVDEPLPAEPVRPVAAAAPPDVKALLARGRAQYLAGAPTAAAQTFARVLELDPRSADAQAFMQRVARTSVDRNAARTQTAAQLLNEVERAWQRPAVSQEPPSGSAVESGPSPLIDKLNQVILPSVNFSGMELSRVVTTLSIVSEEFDQSGTMPKGVNIVLVDPTQANPLVNITLRNLSLKRVLDLVTDSVGYQYEVQADAIVVRPGGEKSALDTQFFPVSRSTVLRMTGRGAQGSGGNGNSGIGDPGAGGALTAAAPQSIEGEGQAIRNFLQLAGVSFENTAGSTLAFDGSQLIVTQTGRNLERIRNILARYSDVRQVEIEAKFMEVQDGTLDELGINWNVATKASLTDPRLQSSYIIGNRSLADAFKNATTSQQIQITGQPPIDVGAPVLPGTVNLGTTASPLASLTGIFGEFNVQAIVRALAQKSGTELLSAPKLTVLSGNQATITVAQELRYPQSYGQVQSQVGTGSASGGGSAGVSITAGTPQEFTTRNIGVELKVTPTVEEDDYSISLDLNPKVTEFEGFVEYGGPSVAISQGTTVTVPPGFYQPIFAVRELTTKVTIWDGATLVMGGLTREDTRKTNDKVPVIGNIPVLGRLFRSNGESAQKRNLLIFVTANLVSPGGSLKKQAIPGVPAGTIFQNPTIVTPSGATGRAAGRR